MKTKLLLLNFLCCIAAYSQSGTIDATFGTNGKTTTGFGTNRNTANAIAFQPDGKFIVAGTYISNRGDNDFAMARYNNDGSLDASFGSEGKVATDFTSANNDNNYIYSVDVLPDGKIMVVGISGKTGFPGSLAVVRYHANGTLDAGFGNNGKLMSQLMPFTSFGTKLVFQPDGKFLITSLKQFPADPEYYLGVERYTPDGIADTSFGTNGLAIALFGSGQSTPASLTLQPDGKIVVAGRYQTTNSRQVAVARFNVNGTLDTGFDGDGKIITTFGAGTISEAIEVYASPDGKITVAGIVYGLTRNFTLVRYNSNGSLDASFDGDGKAMNAFTDPYDNISAVSKQPDGKYLAAIRTDNFALASTDIMLRRFNGDGTTDNTFGTNGQVATTFDTGLNEAQAVRMAPDGKIVVAGKSVPLDNGNFDFAVARYTGNGVIDNSLDNDGKITVAFEKGSDLLGQLLVQPDDKFIAVGISAHRQGNNTLVRNIALSKYNSDGSLDTTFGTSGKVVSVFGQNYNTITAAALQPDGKIVVGNSFYNFTMGTATYYELIRYRVDGSLDITFGTNGKAAINFEAAEILVQPDGKLIIAGVGFSNGTESGFYLGRLHANGIADTGFDTDGTAFIPLGNAYFGKISAMLQPDGKIIISGSASHPDLYNNNPAFVAVRFNPNGSLDTTFGSNGKTATLVKDNCFAYGGFLQPDSTLLMAGMSFGEGLIYFSTARYTVNGILDSTYGNNGIASDTLAFDYRLINDVVLQPDGKFLVALSQYNQPSGSYDFRIRRFNPDGSHDPEMGGTTGIATAFFNGYDEAFAIGLQSDHKILLAGVTHNGISNDFAITRYTNQVLDLPGFDTGIPVTVFPNPARDILHIAANDGDVLLACSVYNMLGQLVYSNAGAASAIDVQAFERGVYILQVKTSKGTISKKFIRE